MTVESVVRYAATAKVGPFSFTPADCRVSATEALTLTKDIVNLPKPDTYSDFGWQSYRRTRLEGNSIFIGLGTLTEPEIGDLKVSYQVRRPGSNVTVFGQQQGQQLTAYLHKGKDRLFRLFDSDRETAIGTLKTEHKIMGWAIGIGGFLMMWIGMSMFFGPLVAVGKIIPFIGQIGEKAIGCATFPLAK